MVSKISKTVPLIPKFNYAHETQVVNSLSQNLLKCAFSNFKSNATKKLQFLTKFNKN
jgi:hypothetical protein